MIDVSKFATAIEDFKNADENRETLIKSTRDFQRDAKRAIGFAHNTENDFKKCDQMMQKSQKQGHDIIQNILVKQLRLKFEPSFTNAIEEYLEAVIFIHLKKTNCQLDKIISFQEILEGDSIMAPHVTGLPR